MKNFALTIIIIIFPTLSFSADWSLPNSPSSGIGDQGTFYLQNQGIAYHVLNNDILGLSDKLMTGSSSLIYLKQLENYKRADGTLIQSGFEFSLHGRLITPVIQTTINGPKLKPQPKNRFYADWLEVKTAYSKTIGSYRFESSLSLDDYGNYAGRRIQNTFHNLFGAEDEQPKFGPLSIGTYGSVTVGAGYFVNQDLLGMLYLQQNHIMQAWILKGSYMKESGKDFSYGAQASLVRQVYSEEYRDDITSFRAEAGFSARWRWYQMSVGYVTPYLKYDEHGQFYINPLILNWDF